MTRQQKETPAMNSTDSRNSLTLPLYASKPQRRIPGTRCVAVQMYRSSDNSVRQYAVFTTDGLASLGTAHWHGKRRYFPGGYTMTPVRRIGDERWSNLTEFAVTMGDRNGIDVRS